MPQATARKGKIGMDPAMPEPLEDTPTVEDVPDVTEASAEPVVDEVDEEEDEEEGRGIEFMEDDEELYPGGPVGRELKAWKAQYGDIYVTSFDVGHHVVWRPINRFEYRRLVSNLEQSLASDAVPQSLANLNNEEAMCELCVLHPPMNRTESAAFPAGQASIVAQEIMEASAFVALEVRKL